jgi:hypothetical protein
LEKADVVVDDEFTGQRLKLVWNEILTPIALGRGGRTSDLFAASAIAGSRCMDGLK